MDFVTAWKRAKPPIAMAAVINEARAMPVPPAGLIYENPSLQPLVSIFSCLQQQHGKAPFFLSARQAGNLVGVDRTTAWRMLQVLMVDGIIRVERVGDQGPGNNRKASEYRYIA